MESGDHGFCRFIEGRSHGKRLLGLALDFKDCRSVNDVCDDGTGMEMPTRLLAWAKADSSRLVLNPHKGGELYALDCRTGKIVCYVSPHVLTRFMPVVSMRHRFIESPGESGNSVAG